MESGSLIKFQVGDADELQRTPLNFIKIGFITSRKQGILLQIRKDDLQNNIFKSATLSVNNNGKEIKGRLLKRGVNRWFVSAI